MSKSLKENQIKEFDIIEITLNLPGGSRNENIIPINTINKRGRPRINSKGRL